ncbi:hypothetical protein [uncultured Rhodoferax sp.]|nr:hypothetical protein [uncultured Rhodoferax sp.]
MTNTDSQDIAARWLAAANMTPAMHHLTQAFEAAPDQPHAELDLCLRHR